MLFLIIFFPLLGFLSSIFLGQFFGTNACILTTLLIFFATCLSIFLFLKNIYFGDVYILKFFKWIYSDTLQIDWNFCFDTLTCLMLVVVTFISCLVHLYSSEYMKFDPHLPRFVSYLSLFTFFMLILVTANNFLQMFVGWEGVGVSSYLLINFWFTRVQANKSAIKAMLLNRVGDFALLIAIFSIIFVFNSLDYDIIFTLTPFILDYRVLVINFQINIIDFISIFLFFGAMGKSAQIGLHTWLPDAMEGPTPVSALIHAATMVTAGVFLLSRCSYFLEFSPFCLDIIMLIGSFTAFFAATTGLFQNDMKKVIAYSTCSQLGYMVFSCGLSSYEVGLFHLFNHAFFKALLFLGAGSVIHAAGDEQDMRRLGGLKNILPFSYAIMVIGSLALMGFPFLAGFFSKDVILETSFSKYTITSHLCFLLGILSAFATSFYSVRLIYLVFLSNPNANRNVLLNSHESGWKITFPLFLLSLFSIFVGYFFKDFFIGFGTSYWGAAIFILPQNYLLPDVEFLDNKIKIMPFIVSFLGAFSSIYLYRFNIFYLFSWKMFYTFKLLYTFFNKKWFFDRFYNQLISQSSLKFGYFFSYKMVDRGVLEVFGPSGITLIIQRFRDFFKKFQSGYVFHYVSILVIFTLIFLLFSTKSIFLLIFLFLFLF